MTSYTANMAILHTPSTPLFSHPSRPHINCFDHANRASHKVKLCAICLRFSIIILTLPHYVPLSKGQHQREC